MHLSGNQLLFNSSPNVIISIVLRWFISGLT